MDSHMGTDDWKTLDWLLGEVDRLQKLVDALMSGVKIEFRPPAMPESEYINYLLKLVVQQNEEIARRYQQIGELRDELANYRAYAEIKAGGIHWQLESRKKVVAKVRKFTIEECAQLVDGLFDNEQCRCDRAVNYICDKCDTQEQITAAIRRLATEVPK